MHVYISHIHMYVPALIVIFGKHTANRHTHVFTAKCAHSAVVWFWYWSKIRTRILSKREMWVKFFIFCTASIHIVPFRVWPDLDKIDLTDFHGLSGQYSSYRSMVHKCLKSCMYMYGYLSTSTTLIYSSHSSTWCRNTSIISYHICKATR